MRKYKIVEMKDGHGNSKFQIKGRYGWGLFRHWCNWGHTHDTIKSATDEVNNYINEEKSDQRFKVKEYVYTTVPNHVPEEQIGKFMEMCNEK